MALFTKRDIAAAITRRPMYKTASTLLVEATEAFSESKSYDIFLSHSILDDSTVWALGQILEGMGYSVYIDWVVDKQLDRSKVDKRTAARLRNRMQNCKSLFVATSDNTSKSKWIPWELGYFDGYRRKAAILPIVEVEEASNEYVGQEYFGLYPYVDNTHNTLFIQTDKSNFVTFEDWIKSR